LILVLAVHETEDLAVTLEWTVTRLRVTDFWTCAELGVGRNFCGLLEWLVPELNPAKTKLNSAIRISSSAMTRWYAFERIVAG
jgi:hypothetical protein